MISNKGASLAAINAGFPATAIAANTLHIALFKGTKPDFNQIFTLLHGAGWNVKAVTALGLTQANFLGSIAFAAMTPIVNPSARTLTLPFGGNAATLTGVADGTPTYYVARIVAAAGAGVASWANFVLSASTSTLLAGPAWMGTVGGQGSDAELQFIGGTIKTGQAYRFLDMTFQL
ncbi:hypothetical protein pEaSNUABM35_00077 [Erwinia phage pEa_SNUABM_35]|uniref:Uncharacterized protein n=1 Tax=Erwinia phage pEa_SNUABM_35 TaxID=2869557 RepID=A0AAE8C242_9CAUD|nr:hypothetical protein MPK65_gp077 [Erwinia phage pEa_SNUABM_35]QZE59994.1 hypothetical protein pEaSNUABM35_00077 [Erwinia phage pEa_SNUABM_35]QZE60330.1 hypothetical protein pEaSNUABM36_00077 [Erwinia phage pEa_SNUABM_36]